MEWSYELSMVICSKLQYQNKMLANASACNRQSITTLSGQEYFFLNFTKYEEHVLV